MSNQHTVEQTDSIYQERAGKRSRELAEILLQAPEDPLLMKRVQPLIDQALGLT